mgnify:CR=1 FL=1
MRHRWIRGEDIFIAGIVLLWATLFFLGSRGVTLWMISEGKSFVRYLTIVCGILLVYALLARMIRYGVRARRGPSGEVQMLVGFLKVLTGVAVILAFTESTGKLGLVSAIGAGFAGMFLGWSLQAPVSGVAAWILITLRRPFRIGDRISFPSLGLVGDVVDIGWMYTVLNQVGGSVGSEEPINRNIMIPNAMLFSQVSINYTKQQEEPYFLDEVVVRMTYGSDWDEAERIAVSAAREVTADIIRHTGIEPYTRSDFYEYGVLLRLRYMTRATERPRIAHEINRRICRDITASRKVDFAIPFVYSFRKGEQPRPSAGIRQKTQQAPTLFEPSAGEGPADAASAASGPVTEDSR